MWGMEPLLSSRRGWGEAPEAERQCVTGHLLLVASHMWERPMSHFLSKS